MVPRRLGGDDGRDDAAVGGAGGRSRRPSVPALPTAIFAGYLAVWTAFGIVARVAFVCDFARPRPACLGTGRAVRRGAVIVLAGIYELTPLKQQLLRGCRSPHDRGEHGASGPAWRTACTASVAAWA